MFLGGNLKGAHRVHQLAALGLRPNRQTVLPRLRSRRPQVRSAIVGSPQGLHHKRVVEKDSRQIF
jgi:hypothetical protein